MSTPARDGYNGQDMATIIGRRVHMLMWDRRETQSSLARVLGIQQSGVSKKILGERDFGINELFAICDHYGVEPGWLLRRPDPEECAIRDSNPEPADLERVARRQHLQVVSPARAPRSAS